MKELSNDELLQVSGGNGTNEGFTFKYSVGQEIVGYAIINGSIRGWKMFITIKELDSTGTEPQYFALLSVPGLTTWENTVGESFLDGENGDFEPISVS